MSLLNRDYLEFMLKDMLWEFKQLEGTNTEGLLKVFARQFSDLLDSFNCYEQKTVLGDDYPRDSEIGKYAVGKQLEGIGDIVDISKKKASQLLNSVNYGSKTSDYYSINDNNYREFIRYKIFLNNAVCTYRDVIKNVKLFWRPPTDATDEEVKRYEVKYEEWPKRPGAMILSTKDLKPDNNAKLFLTFPVLKSAGVELLRQATTVYGETTAIGFITANLHECCMQSKLPPIMREFGEIETNSSTDGWSVFNTVLSGEADELYYFERYDNGIKITLKPYYRNFVSGKIAIPSFIKGRPVKQLYQTFKGLSTICQVYIPYGVEEIGSEAFKNTGIMFLELPSTISKIGENAFYGCSAFKIWFKGTREAWNNIIVGEGNEILEQSVIITLN